MRRFTADRSALLFKVGLLFFWMAISITAQGQPVFNVKNYGATGNGTTLDTAAINNAIQAANGAGGGIVEFPAGNYLSVSIHLASNVTLYLDAGATITAASSGFDPIEPSPWDAYQDFGHTYFHDSLIWGENLTNIGFAGPGKITGNGHLQHNAIASSYISGQADKAIALKWCTNVTFSDVTITRAGHFAVLANGITNMYVNNVKFLCSTDRDALNLINSSHVYITNSDIEGSDDAMVLKSDFALGVKVSSMDIRVENCTILSTENNATQFGSETIGDFSNVSFSNLTITGAGKAGIGITSNDGSIIDGVTYDHVTMANCASPIFLKISNQDRPGSDPHSVGRIRNISINNVTATHSTLFNRANSSAIFGYPGIPIENVVLRNVNVSNIGGAPSSQANIVPAETNRWTPQSLDPYPSYGWLVRHAKGVSFFNCEAHYDSTDGRPAFLNDGDGQGIRIDGFVADSNTTGADPSPYDAGFKNAAGYQITNATATAGGNLRINSQSSTTTSIVAPPSYSPPGNTYSTPQTVTLSSSTAGCSIRYTVDGSTPTSTSGLVYTGSIPVTGDNVVIKAVAYQSGMADSAVNTAIYHLVSVAATPVFTPPAGSYSGAQLVAITSLTTLINGGSIRYTTDGSTPTPVNGIIYTGPVSVNASQTLRAIAFASGLTDSVINSAVYSIIPTAIPPAFSLPGGSYNGAQILMLSSATSGASIRYTIDGSTPSSSNGNLYSGAFIVSGSQTVKAIAYAPGLSESAVTSESYTIASAGLSFEAESISFVPTGAPAAIQTDSNTSGGQWEALQATGLGQSIEYTIPNLPAGTYDFQLFYKGNTQRGILSLALDGNTIGTNLDQYSATAIYPIRDYGEVTFPTSGNHVIRQTVVGKNSSASGYWLSADKFVFAVNTPPAITAIQDQAIPVNSATGPLAFRVGDAETSAANLVLTAISSDPTVIPPSGLVLGGSGGNRTLIVTPAQNQTGTVTITVTVSDGTVSRSSSFDLAVDASAIQSWRLQYFGSIDDAGNSADLADPDHDGRSNLLEFVAHTDPTKPDLFDATLQVEGSLFTMTYHRSSAALDEITVTCEAADSLLGPWNSDNVSEQILSDDGNIQWVKESVPIDGAGRKFLRLQMTKP